MWLLKKYGSLSRSMVSSASVQSRSDVILEKVRILVEVDDFEREFPKALSPNSQSAQIIHSERVIGELIAKLLDRRA